MLPHIGLTCENMTRARIIEFRIPLDSQDMRDKPLEPGASYKVLISYNSSADNFTSKHTKKESFTMSIE